ncbi:flagellar hook-associated protein FlgL [Brevibacillus composti]|uniref:Flagellar hook-associated protein FlgL n=1 Tax=Brevibacillus composti TaxID=2796470 RepID=A0A7T5JNE9_9BACL|nr:flagellar hook-associated protein FlgL [Brevibacillus composti]QQE74114.1 flagellar hook-associated protein FlgL [Brevibacillus composti]QUO41198.1 flagellar hook-associated protein FlgL [Brevibacillus composti]
MAIRVTQNMLNNNMLRNLHQSMRHMDKLQEQLSSGKKVSRPSDDPVVATRGMFYRSSLMEVEQYQRNVDDAESWVELTDKTLDEVGNVMQRISELLVYSGDGALSSSDLQAMAQEVAQLKEHLGTLANQQLNGKYIFGGSATNIAPYNPAAPTVSGGVGDFTSTNSEEVNLEVSQNVFVGININAQNVFNYPNNAGNMFNVLDQILNTLNAGKSAASFGTAIKDQFDNLLSERAILGAKANRIELVKDRLSVQEVNVTGLMSKNEDADSAKVITELKSQENVHRAALGAGARIIQPTLLDFLR